MPLSPRTSLPTHEVTNQVPPLEEYNLFETDVVLREGLVREGAGWATDRAHTWGGVLGQADVIQDGHLANACPPTLKVFDRTGQRIDEAEFHPSYHRIMGLAMEHGVHNLAWTSPHAGGHVAHTVQEYLLAQVEAGTCCPLTMTYAVVPALRHQPDVAQTWIPRVTSSAYDGRMIPAHAKTGATMGMAMTEKQGGSDVRANTTQAVRDGDGWRLTGHKWFCSAPMCDAFLTLARTEVGITCFLVPRWLPDDTRNAFYIQRLKDKLGNKSNASSEIEYLDTYAEQVGEEGRGIRTILEMVHHTRLDCTTAAAALGRAALVQAIHHACHRRAFGSRLIDKPLMRNVLADLALEVEASTLLTLRLARSYDAAEDDETEAAVARIAVPVGKYWTNKRCPTLIGEAMECLGGAGYVEESPLPRLYREAPLNGIWEGSGNVICLDVLRALGRDPRAGEAFVAELMASKGKDPRLDAAIDRAVAELSNLDDAEYRARRLTESLAMALQGALMVEHAPQPVADAFLATRLEGSWGHAFGTLPTGVDTGAILTRAWPAVEA